MTEFKVKMFWGKLMYTVESVSGDHPSGQTIVIRNEQVVTRKGYFIVYQVSFGQSLVVRNEGVVVHDNSSATEVLL